MMWSGKEKTDLGSVAFFKNAPVGVQRAKPSDRQASRRAVRRSREWTRAKAQKATRLLKANFLIAKALAFCYEKIVLPNEVGLRLKGTSLLRCFCA